jgi:tRNA A37 threonylcarbamoyladenosine biosynthesis protein TsaE
MPPELQQHLCRLLCKAKNVKKVAVVIDGKLGRGKTSLSTLLGKSGCFE